jgi:hypothetical protein
MQWFEEMLNSAKEIIRERKPLNPVLLMVGEDENPGIVPLSQFLNDKDAMALVIKIMVERFNPEEYLLLMESYIKVLDQKDGADRAMGQLLVDGTVSVSQLPSAQECITVVYGTREGEKLGHVIFKRKGRQIHFEEINWWKEGKAEGRCLNLRPLKDLE